jgi:hypothetical protein
VQKINDLTGVGLPAFLFLPYIDIMSRIRRSSEVAVMLCSFPLDCRRWIEEQAARNLSPMNSVIIGAVRKQMETGRHQKDARAERTEAVD